MYIPFNKVIWYITNSIYTFTIYTYAIFIQYVPYITHYWLITIRWHEIIILIYYYYYFSFNQTNEFLAIGLWYGPNAAQLKWRERESSVFLLKKRSSDLSGPKHETVVPEPNATIKLHRFSIDLFLICSLFLLCRRRRFTGGHLRKNDVTKADVWGSRILDSFQVFYL